MFSLQCVLRPPQVAEEAESCGLMLSWPLQVMESVVKNCGQTVHDEVANKQTMEELKEILKVNRLFYCNFFSPVEKQQQQEEKRVASLVSSLGKD